MVQLFSSLGVTIYIIINIIVVEGLAGLLRAIVFALLLCFLVAAIPRGLNSLRSTSCHVKLFLCQEVFMSPSAAISCPISVFVGLDELEVADPPRNMLSDCAGIRPAAVFTGTQIVSI